MISPLLANVALHGMEEIAKEGAPRWGEKPMLVRYADDFVILYSDKAELQRIAERVRVWLADMGLQLSQRKTRTTHTLDTCEGKVGFDFLGFTVRQFRVGKNHSGKDPHQRLLGFKTIIRPSKEAVKRHTWEIGRKLRKLKSAPQEAVIEELPPIIRGWCNYHHWVVCSKVFNACDHNTFGQLVRWGKTRHPGKTNKWVNNKYFRRRDDRTVFGTYIKDQEGNPNLIYVRDHADTQAEGYEKVRGEASPYDGNLLYWAKRLKQHPLANNEKAKLLKIQRWQCPRCGLYFKDGDLLEVDHSIPTALGGKDAISNKWVYHRHCHDEKTAEDMARIARYKAAGIIHK